MSLYHKKQHTIKKRHFGFLKCLFLCHLSLWPFSAVVLVINLFISSAMANDTCLSAKQQLAKIDEWVIVSKIIDGDTIHLQDGRKVRFIGINTPEIGRRGESSEPFAYQAHKALVELLGDNDRIGLSYDQDKKDRYKRLLAYVLLADGRSVEQTLLSQGLAYSIVIPPNARHLNCYRTVERTARISQLGLWQLPENQVLDAYDLSSASKGYRFISGTVSDYNESKRSIYLKLTPKLSIRIAKKDQAYFSDVKFNSLVGKKLLVRGWVNTNKRQQSIQVRTAHDIKLMD